MRKDSDAEFEKKEIFLGVCMNFLQMYKKKKDP